MTHPTQRIAVLNASSVITDAEVQATMAAVQVQITRDFFPAWGSDAVLGFVPRHESPPPGLWWIVVLDDADQAGVLGYHDLTPDNLPMGKVFAATTRRYGGLWSVTFSHELLEILGDPWINKLADQPGIKDTEWSWEMCDAVEEDSLGYDINSIRVSDFILPDYFMPKRAGARYDFCNHLYAPFSLAPGGYSILKVSGRWKQIEHASTVELTGDAKSKKARVNARPRVGSRRERRMNRALDGDWIISAPVFA